MATLYKLGSMYEQGTCVTKDLELAEHYYLRAAAIDFAPAENALAAMYDLGIGFSVDKSRAYYWAMLAAAQGDKSASARANLLAAGLSPAELAEAQQRIKTLRR
ncbi:hypothetical protein GOB94_08715 [Granulicella sp. 5B5]|uniref:SEL1-like repeat protein n=1 Tax=Granulicella sp. 5B5 TaxID=1617967 RepID=UPI0015F3A6F1|nr:SEL1-like repeat protein [Granulicella sp. 5B5]QMV18755.1 hypothetical protein GOB94_08715 [Granulicella sp. 5B5]